MPSKHHKLKGMSSDAVLQRGATHTESGESFIKIYVYLFYQRY